MSNQLEFTPQNASKTIYSRRMHGSERLTATCAEHVDGFGHIFDCVHVTFKADISPVSLFASARAAWIKTRFMVPWIALRTSTIEKGEPNSWLLTYEASNNEDAADSWADKTIIWKDGSLSMAERSETAIDEYWKPSAGRFGMEIHLARAPSEGYLVMCSLAHWLADGRGGLPVIDIFFSNLKGQINGSSETANSLPWGQEIQRLSPAVVRAVQTMNEVSSSPTENVPGNTTKYFLRPLIESRPGEALTPRQTDTPFSKAETSAFHAICKAHKINVTAVLSSIHMLADIETALRVAPNSKKFEEVLDTFKTSDVYPIFTNVADRRSYLSSRWPSVTCPGGFGGVVNDNFATFHSMDLIRNCIRVGEDGSIRLSLSNKYFWDGLASETQTLLKANVKSSPDSFLARQHAIDTMVPNFDPNTVTIPGIACSSVGNLSTLNLFENFRPAIAGPDPDTPFVVQDMTFAGRAVGVPAVVAVIWEYDGRMVIHHQGSPKWHSDKAWGLFGDSVRRSFLEILAGDDFFAKSKL